MNVITGATGSVGMHLVREWLAAGEPVRVLVRPSASRERLRDFLLHALPADPTAFDRLEWAEGDLTDGPSLELAFTGAARVIHAAALVSFNRRDAAAMLATNRDGTAEVVNAMLACNVPELVYISSVAALGRQPGQPVVHENTVFEDGPLVSDYARSKYKAELEVWRGQEEGLRVLALNPVIVIGPGDYSRSSAALLTQVARGLRFFPTGSNGFVAATDVAQAAHLLAADGAWGERFLICGFHAPYRDVLATMADALGVPRPHLPVKRWVAEVAWRVARVAEWITGKPAFVTKTALRTAARNHRYSTEKIESRLGTRWSPAPLEEAVRLAVAHHSFVRERAGGGD